MSTRSPEKLEFRVLGLWFKVSLCAPTMRVKGGVVVLGFLFLCFLLCLEVKA